MKIYKSTILIGALIGGLWFSAAMFNSTAYALSDSSTTSSTAAPTNTPTDTGTNATADPTSLDTHASTVTSPTEDASQNETTPTVPDDSSSSGTDDTSATDPTTNTTPPTTTDQASNNTTATNDTQGNADSGNATVANSPQGGNATSGTAGDTANQVNSIQSSSNLSGSGLQTFIDNINGDYTGNVNIDPSNYLTSDPANSQQTPVTDNTSNSGTIDNTVDLGATSGGATVEDNGVAGNATTGDATAEANIINLINSSITDGESFLGIININGNLNGNIYLPSDLLDSLLGSPYGVSSPVSSSNTTNTNNETVNNAVTLLAQSGQAGVISNGSAGNATSGNATTNLNLYNLTNSEIVAGNLLLVFINVSGNWVGLLFNAPSGTTTAAVGGGVTQDSQIPVQGNITNTNNETINNNLYLNSTSGNALVTYNRVGGNATSGNATSSANIVNILGDQISLTGWLGILIINVYGSWTGSLEAQPVVTTTSASTTPPSVTLLTVKKNAAGNPEIITLSYPYDSNSNSQDTQSTNTTTVASHKKPVGLNNFASITSPSANNLQKSSKFSMLVGILGFAFAGLAILAERVISFMMKP